MKIRNVAAVMVLTAAAMAFNGPVQATVISFAGSMTEIFPGSPQVEGSFTYSAFSGVLFRSGVAGNPAPDLEGRFTVGGGLATFARTDGGLFTFDRVDVGQRGLGISRFVVFTGLLDGVALASDSLESSSVSESFVTRDSLHLAGVTLDELRVQLEGGGDNANAYWEMIDNLVLTEATIPEPATLVLMGFGLAGLGFSRRRVA